MKQAIINLYNRDYLTFYVIAITFDIISFQIFHIPIVTILILVTMLTLSTVNILRKFKK